MLNVNNLDESLQFDCDKLGMKLLRERDFLGAELPVAFADYGGENETTAIGWTRDCGTPSTSCAPYGHVALGVNDIHQTCADLKQRACQTP